MNVDNWLLTLIERMFKALIKSLENKHLTGLLPENTDF